MMNLKTHTNCVSPFILNSRKCKQIYSNRNEIRGYLERGEGMTKGMEDEGDRHGNDFDYGDNIMITSKLTKLYTSMCTVYCMLIISE